MSKNAIDLKALLESKMGIFEPVESNKQVIEAAERKVPNNLLFDAGSAEFKPELVTTQSAVGIRALSIEEAIEYNAKIDECVEKLFQEGVDFGTIPNCRSKFLFKAGSEKILNLLGVVARTEIVDKVEDYNAPYFSYTCKSWLVDASGCVRAESYAVCNSRENKYARSKPYNVQNILVQIEVYFVEDNIWTFSQDGELRLTIMAALAQEESRKVSERVRAGQKVSREKGVLYGSGNILGYKLHRNIDDVTGKWNPEENTYIIDPEQAATVKMIFDMCLQGKGYVKICEELTLQQRKNSSGKVSWSQSKIGRILHNKTYAGYLGYNKSYTDNYLEHSRVKNLDAESYTYVKGNWEPIISEEDWYKVQEILDGKTKKIQQAKNNSSNRQIGKKPPKDIWVKKLRCSCGASYRKNKWRTNKKTGEEIYGYQCYQQLNYGAGSSKAKADIEDVGCTIKMVGDWKLEFMAKSILEALWTNRREAVDIAMQLIEQNYSEEAYSNAERNQRLAIEQSIEKYQRRLQNLLEMRMDGELTKEKYLVAKTSVENDLAEQEKLLAEIEVAKPETDDKKSNLVAIRQTMEQFIDFSGEVVSHDIIEKVVAEVMPMSNNKFRWTLNLLGDNHKVFTYVDGRRNKAMFKGRPEKSIPFFSPSTGCYQRNVMLSLA